MIFGWAKIAHNRSKSKGASGKTGVDNTFSYTRYKKTKIPGETISAWKFRVLLKVREAKK